jgi:GH15 family glucan-1,4-alpha-glucosidase
MTDSEPVSGRAASLELGVIGNCQISALLDDRGRVVWSCLPRLDSDPVFCTLLAEGPSQAARGFYEVELIDLARSEQRYIPNTPILETILEDRHGGRVKVTDFCPRFEQYDRVFHPVAIARYVEPLAGSPRVVVRLRPAAEYGAQKPETTFGSNHIRYMMPGLTLRLTTDLSLNHIMEEKPLVLDRPVTLILGPDESLQDSVVTTGRRFFEKTRDYWLRWVRGLAVPFEWQEAVIRAAITLKLCTFEDTGAVIAAMTTSIPEAAASGRCWDYRFCWLRDSYFTVHALNRLGATRTMEAYLRYIVNVSVASDGGVLQPVYGITGEQRLTERIVASLSGYRGDGPVRVGNQAWEQVQNDVYGSVVLSAAHVFFDARLTQQGDAELFRLLERIGERAVERHDQPDAGLWEYRGRQRVHTFSSLMCWAACDRLGRIATRTGATDRARYWHDQAERIREVIHREAWDESRQCFTEAFGRPELDASMLLMNELGFIAADDPRYQSTVAAIEQDLRRGDHLFRYKADDDFGSPENAFNICTFWYINALASVGRREEARALFENILSCRTRLGLLSEDVDPQTGELWGNFPQTYSLVGIILAAIRLSEPWEKAF